MACERCKRFIEGTYFRLGPGGSDTAVLGPFYVIVRRDLFDPDEILVSVTTIPPHEPSPEDDSGPSQSQGPSIRDSYYPPVHDDL